MPWQAKRGRPAYLDYFTPAEDHEFHGYERRISEIDHERQQLSATRRVLMNRAIQRARKATGSPK